MIARREAVELRSGSLVRVNSGPMGESQPGGGQVFDLAAIEASLRMLQRDFARINAALVDRRESLVDEVIANMMAGYAYVDGAIAQGIDLFAMGNLSKLLEINYLVLCGADPAARTNHADLLRETEKHFYDEAEAGIRDVIEWHALHRHESVWKRAAGVYIRILSEPQLFLEGNHRSGALIMSYLLGREGRAPFVLTVENAQAYFDPSSLIKKTKKRSVAMRLRGPRLVKTFAKFLRREASAEYLRPSAVD